MSSIRCGAGVLVACVLLISCSSGPSAPPAGAGDEMFRALAADIIDATLRRSPSAATYLGVHRYDDRLESFAPADLAAEVSRARDFRRRLDAIDPASLSAEATLDRELLQREMDNLVLEIDVVRPWAKDADSYTAAATDAVFAIMKRNFAPADTRLRSVIARERLIPALLTQARMNLDNPPEVFTRVAINQIDGIQNFFRTDLPLAFADVRDQTLLADFRTTNEAVLAALASYKRWLQTDLLPRSKGSFALGAISYSALLAASNMIETPLDELLRVAETQRAADNAAFIATARAIDPSKPAAAVLADIAARHPAPDALLASTQAMLDSLGAFVRSRNIATIPSPIPATVRETPPFMRATTSASMDTPGPWETGAVDAYFYMTLPDPRWTAAEQEEYMRNWYDAITLNVAVHEVYPGHYLQFLYAKSYPTDVRKVFGAASNSEGWAHYVEQMMVDEGFQADNPAYRLAQLQDALLRDVRFIVGIKMHTQGMTIDEATRLFVEQAYQPAPVARAEATRGAGDPLYGYYTMGKLAILKLRDDYRRQKGAAFSLQEFHNTFIKLGPLPLPLMRQAMLGERGTLF